MADESENPSIVLESSNAGDLIVSWESFPKPTPETTYHPAIKVGNETFVPGYYTTYDPESPNTGKSVSLHLKTDSGVLEMSGAGIASFWFPLSYFTGSNVPDPDADHVPIALDAGGKIFFESALIASRLPASADFFDGVTGTDGKNVEFDHVVGGRLAKKTIEFDIKYVEEDHGPAVVPPDEKWSIDVLGVEPGGYDGLRVSGPPPKESPVMVARRGEKQGTVDKTKSMRAYELDGERLFSMNGSLCVLNAYYQTYMSDDATSLPYGNWKSKVSVDLTGTLQRGGSSQPIFPLVRAGGGTGPF